MPGFPIDGHILLMLTSFKQILTCKVLLSILSKLTSIIFKSSASVKCSFSQIKLIKHPH